MNLFRGKALIGYWLAVIVPAMIVGALALSLLRHEQERLRQRAQLALDERADLVASRVEVTVTDIRTELIRELATVDAADPQPALTAWLADEPLVARVFVWDAQAGEAWTQERDATKGGNEAPEFRRLYADLLTQQWSPEQVQTETDDMRAPQQSQVAVNIANAYDYTPESQALQQPMQQQLSPEQTYAAPQVQQRAQVYRGLTESNVAKSLPTEARSGLQPWFADNRLWLLVWYTVDDYGTVYGVELDVAALTATLQEVLGAPGPSESLRLLNEAGEPVATAAGAEQAGEPATATAFIGPALPYWRLSLSAPLAVAGGGSFGVVAGLLVGIFVVAIVCGGTLLIWQARRYQAEAARKTSFVSNVSHELKTPLTSIRMYAELLQEDRVADPARKQQMLGVIVNESQRLSRLVANVLDFSRLEQRRREYQAADLDLPELAETVLAAQAWRLDAAGMTLHWKWPDAPLTIRADRDAVEQILLNLTENALKYAATGGDLTVGARLAGDAVCLEVADRGPGIPKARRDQVFEAFYRLDDALTATTGGTGLGLSICRRLAQGMGGDLYCTDRPGGGTIFVVRLPVAIATEDAR